MDAGSEKRHDRLSRRGFVRAGAAAALTAASWRRVYGANERIGVGMIGYGLIGQPHLKDFREERDVAMVAVAEAHAGRLEAAAEACRTPVAKYRDFRKMLENKDVDAVCISTPDHWHALQTMLACAAGKDVYVEKPLTVFVREGRWMVEVARRYKRVVQVGTQQRSGPHYARARQFIRDGRLGQLVSVHFNYHRNLMPGFGNPPDREPPAELDWDMFVGPAPMRPYNENCGIYQFRWIWDFAGGQMTNWGQHGLDIAYWIMDVTGPRSVYSRGGRWFLEDNCETPDSQETVMWFDGRHEGDPDWSLGISIRECSRGYSLETGGDQYSGTKGLLRINRNECTVTPDAIVPAINLMPGVEEGHPVGGPEAVEERGRSKPRTERVRDRWGKPDELMRLHVRNFLDCVKSRQEPVSDIESGHRVSAALHLANLSARLGGRILRWDAEKEEVIDDAEANRMLVRPYRKPWDAELRSLKIS